VQVVANLRKILASAIAWLRQSQVARQKADGVTEKLRRTQETKETSSAHFGGLIGLNSTDFEEISACIQLFSIIRLLFNC
jgi:hypothetical protein